MAASSKRVKLLEPHVDHAGTDSSKSCKSKRKGSNSSSRRGRRLPKSYGICPLDINSSFAVHFDTFCIVKSREIKAFAIVVVVHLKSVPCSKFGLGFSALRIGRTFALHTPTPNAPRTHVCLSRLFRFSGPSIRTLILFQAAFFKFCVILTGASRARHRSHIHNNTTPRRHASRHRAYLRHHRRTCRRHIPCI